MIAQPNSTVSTMKSALKFTITALDGAAIVDIDRSDADREFFAQQKRVLEDTLNNLKYAEETLNNHIDQEMSRLQFYVVLGDLVLDRGLRTGKVKMKAMLNNIMPKAADMVFGANLVDLTRVEMKTETLLVKKVLDRFDTVPDFPGKQELKADLNRRLQQQINNLAARDEVEVVRAKLAITLTQVISQSSDVLYALEKMLLTRFLRDKEYVREFFMETRTKSKAQPDAAQKSTPTA